MVGALTGLCYARRDGQTYALECPDGADAGDSVVLMQRSDFLVAFIDVPRSAEEHARDYLGYRVRGLFPAPAEETAFDYRLLRAGGVAKAAVFATRRELLERYRALGRPLALPLSLIEATVPALLREGGAFLFVAPEWIEALALPGRKARPEARSLVFPRGDSLARDLASALDSLAAGEMPVRVLAPRAEAERAREALPGAAVYEVAGGGRMRASALFQPRRQSRLPRWGLRIQALLFLVLALATLLYVRSAARERSTLASLESRLAGLRTRVVGAASDRKRLDELSREWAALEARRPVDVYRLLSELSRVLGTEVRVGSLIVDGRLFQVEGESHAALELVARLREDPWFEGVRLLQIVPSQAGLERFRLTGAFRAQ